MLQFAMCLKMVENCKNILEKFKSIYASKGAKPVWPIYMVLWVRFIIFVVLTLNWPLGLFEYEKNKANGQIWP